MIGPYRFSLWNPATKEFKDLPHFLTGLERSLFTLNSDSWGGTKTYNNGSPFFDDTFHKLGTFASGKPHWISDKNRTMSEWKIVYFDFNSETTRVVEKPSCVEKDSYNIRNLRLGVLDECLCLFCVGTNRFDIWVRNKYRAEDSWDRFLNVSYASIYCDPLLRISLNPSLLTLLLVLPNGEVLFAYVSNFLIYNQEDNRFRQCCIYDGESLISLTST
ncbi:PREDICTED: F-box protein CPR30-like [Erythranthe guttata]|uniref:F-box protein CPR30-like n=1 Tax=Erythranthe guttata TaxID=4155 RepID=UPI00064DC635|nr:PREDICTED: F-box protein CPR30-like [Erythranthe guttata]|eukprot:XP_012836681.1 PREDICTED: F-box protein CPR30-like [Erythranthe guttata]